MCLVETSGPGRSGTGHPPEHAVELDGVALQLADHLIVIAADGMVLALDPAGRGLWEALQTGCTVDDLVEVSVLDGELSADIARSNIAHTLASWRALGLIKSGPEANGSAPPPAAAARIAPRLERGEAALDAVFRPGDHPVRVRCNHEGLAAVIQVACGSCGVADADHLAPAIDVIERAGRIIVRADGAVLTRADEPTQNRALARHRCLTALLELARRSRRWLGILHASVIAVDGRCVVFPGAKGSGKSTLTAALVAAGADFVTDDYAPLEQASWQIWPVPYAPGIKRGSWRALRRYFPGIYQHPVHRLAGMQIRYLQLDAARMAPLDRGLPVAALVFPRYQAGAPLEHHPLSPAEAFAALCHSRSLLDRHPDVLAETLRWTETVPAYRFTYGDLDQATKWVLSLSALA